MMDVNVRASFLLRFAILRLFVWGCSESFTYFSFAKGGRGSSVGHIIVSAVMLQIAVVGSRKVGSIDQ